MKLRHLFPASLLLVSCVPSPPPSAPFAHARLYPDYRGVTIPRSIAPLNFMCLSDSVDAVCATFVSGGKSASVAVRGRKVVVEADEWRELLSDSSSSSLSVSLLYRAGGEFRQDTFSVSVSDDAFDPYVSYRLIEPGYEVWNALQIEERDLTSFSTRLLADNAELGGNCMNCHIHGQRGLTSLFHVRGKGGGTFLFRGGRMRKVELKNELMGGGAVYGDVDSSGRFGVFSTNVIIPALHSEGSRRLEVFDTESDLCAADFDSMRMIVSPSVARPDRLETFPCFAPDGRSVFFCSAPALPLPDSLESVRYSVLRVGFDGSAFADVADTVWSAEANGGSASFPKVSPDGRFMLFCVARCGTFPIWHRETDLRMIDLASGREVDVAPLNSPVSETYHSWASSSRWVAFASKRADGQYGRIFIAHIDADGRPSKPFVIPQSDPESDIICLKSYNIPDLTPVSAGFGKSTVEKLFREEQALRFK